MTDDELVGRIAKAIGDVQDQDFNAWLERWVTPAGCAPDAPNPPSRHRIATDEKFARAALSAIRDAGCAVVPSDTAERQARHDRKMQEIEDRIEAGARPVGLKRFRL